MRVNVLISGPLRPSESSVVEVIQNIRRQIPYCRIFLATWTDSQLVRDKVDYYTFVREPTNEEISKIVHARTKQQVKLGMPDENPGCKYSTFKMLHGVKHVCQLAAPYLTESDKVIRFRTDSMFTFEKGYLETLLNSSNYVAKKGDGFDWFAITTFGLFQEVWCFPNMEAYNHHVSESWNPESIVRSRVSIPIEYIDPNKVNCYIIREGGRKHYYG